MDILYTYCYDMAVHQTEIINVNKTDILFQIYVLLHITTVTDQLNKWYKNFDRYNINISMWTCTAFHKKVNESEHKHLVHAVMNDS